MSTQSWPATLERREPRRVKTKMWLRDHSINFSLVAMMLGLIGLIVGTSYGSRPDWPTPIVWYATSAGTLALCVLALYNQSKQARVGAVFGVMVTGTLRGFGYAIQGYESGLRVGAAIGAYMITLGACGIVLALAFGARLDESDHTGGKRRWGG